MTTSKGPRSVGEILSNAREKQALVIEDIAKETHIKPQYLRALEENEVGKLPTGPFRVGFLRMYSEYLGLDSEHMEALFRRDHGEPVRNRKKPLFRRILRSGPVFLQPTYILSAVFALLLIMYVSWQWSIALRPPRLYVALPVDNQQSSSPLIVTGEVAPDTIVLVNDRPASVTQYGSFRAELQVLPGEQMVIVEAKNRRGKSRFVERTVIVVE